MRDESSAEKLQNGENHGPNDNPKAAGDLENGDDKIKANLEVFREVNQHCKNLGLCPRCQLRYLGELYSSVSFSLALDEVKKVSAESILLIFFQLNWRLISVLSPPKANQRVTRFDRRGRNSAYKKVQE